MKNLFRKNLTYLKDIKGETYASIGVIANCSANTISYWINKNFEPKMIEVEKIAQYFEIPIEVLLYTDLENVHLNEKNDNEKISKNVHPIVHPIVHLNEKKEEKNERKEQTDLLILKQLNYLTEQVSKIDKKLDRKGV